MSVAALLELIAAAAITPEEATALVARACPRAEQLTSWGEHELRFELPAAELVPATSALRTGMGGRLAMHAVWNDAGTGGRRLIVTLAPRRGPLLLTFEAQLPDQHMPSLAAALPAASWPEREARDLWGMVPVGHPDPAPLAANADRPAMSSGDLATLSLGPVHGGATQALRVRIHADGELTRTAVVDHFWGHRGVERLVEGKTPAEALAILERTCGGCSSSLTIAFAEAVERAAGFAADVPARGEAIRTLCAEVERMIAHTSDTATLCSALGMYPAAAKLETLVEELRQIALGLTGSRLLFGAVVIGGAFGEPPTATRDLARRLRAMGRRIGSLWDQVGDSPAVVDRSEGLAIIEREQAEALGAVGIVARACRLPTDARKDRPYAFYPGVDFKLSLADTGDVIARARLRVDETKEAIAIACQVIEGMPPGPHRIDVTLPPGRVAHGWAESPRGETMVWLASGADGRIARLRIRSGAYACWPAVPGALASSISAREMARPPGTLVSDIPLALASFGLCTGCVDR